MSLIEQLGGYEKAMSSLKKSNGEDIYLNKFCTIQWWYLKDLLLEHRRANNIFEVLDKVVYVDDFMHDEISVVSNIDDRVWLNDDAAVCIIEMVRHATPEEIQAGNRL